MVNCNKGITDGCGERIFRGTRIGEAGDGMSRIWKNTGKMLLAVLMIAALIHAYLADSKDSLQGRIPKGAVVDIGGLLERTVGDDGSVTYQSEIPEGAGENPVFCMENFLASFEVLLDGECIYSYEDTYMERGVRKHWVELPGDPAGRMLALRFLTDGKMVVDATLSASMYIGEKNAVFCRLLFSEGYAALFFCLSIVIGIVILCGAGLFHVKLGGQKAHGLMYLGIFVIDAGIWVLLDSQFLQIFVGRIGLVSVISFTALMLLPTWMILFVREMMIREWKIFDFLCYATLTVTGLTLAAFALRLQPMYRMIMLQHGLIIVTIVAILRNGIIEVRKYRNQEVKRVLQGFSILSVFIVLAMVVYYRDPSRNYALLYCMGFLGFVVYLVGASFALVYQELENHVSLMAYQHMAFRDALTGLGNRAALDQEWDNDDVSKKVIYIMLDNNGLKRVNDHFGHQEGDRLLVETAKCLREAFGRIGKCFRIGGDEFMVILENMDEKDLKQELTRLDGIIRRENHRRNILISVAYGYAVRNGDGRRAQELYAAADRDMYRNKEKMKRAEAGA